MIEQIRQFVKLQRELQREMQGYACCQEAAESACDAILQFLDEQEKDMFSHTARALDFYDQLSDLVEDQAKWSQETFGSDLERSAVGALKHLAKEAGEVLGALDIGPDETIEELADCFLLLLDATRRAGFKVGNLVDAAQAKMVVNKGREWPKPTSDEPVEHVR